MAIDINIPSQVAQTITNGVTGTAPSQDVVFDALALKENTANKGIANGYVPLNASTKVDSSYLPSYVDDVIEVANFAALPVTGETGKIYITINTGLIYRWSGSIYVQIGGQDPVWGAITGTLSNQTDLQNALDGKQNGFTGYANEIHVSLGTGNDTSGTGKLLLPYASITKALSVATNADLIIVHAGIYNESPTSNVYAPLITLNDSADKTIINGTLTLASATRVKGFKINNLIISNNSSTYIDDCNILTSFTKSGNGFVQIDNTTLQCSLGSLISGSGNTVINGDYLYPLVVNNAGANVIVKISNSIVTPNVLAGTLAIVDSILVSATPTGNAITSSSNTVVTLANSQILVPNLDSVARVNLQGFYSIFNCVFDKPNSTLVSLSATGGPTNSIDYFQYINADKFITQGGTSSQFVKGDGTLGTSVSGTVTSVGLTMPSAFTVASSPITSSGTIAVTGAGVASQYVRGDGQLATLPTSSGGGSSLSYYLNGSVAQGTFGGNAYKQLSKTPVIGTGTDFTINADGYIARFITDAGDPSFLSIPSGNWNLEFYFSASSGGGSPTFYVNVYKVSGTTFTLLGTNSTAPEGITNGTAIDAYFTPVSIPTTSLLVTDRLAIDIYVVHSGRTITLHTEDSHLCQVITTFSTGLAALNGLTNQVQYLATGTSGTDFAINSTTDTHTFNLPVASATNTGKLSSANWSTFNGKQDLLVSSVNIQTINGNSILGSGNIVTTYIRRHATNGTYDYLGFAPTGTAESTATWTLTRLTLSNTGTSAVMHATDSWNNRVTATYI